LRPNAAIDVEVDINDDRLFHAAAAAAVGCFASHC